MSIINSFQKMSLALKPTIASKPVATRAAEIITTTIRNTSNRSKRGVYDGVDIRTGNNVPFSLKKTKRKFKPNIFKKRLYSEILDEMILFHVSTTALRTIDKLGGLDNYLLHSGRVTRGEGWKVRQRLLQKVQDCERKGINVLDPIMLKSNKDNAGI